MKPSMNVPTNFSISLSSTSLSNSTTSPANPITIVDLTTEFVELLETDEATAIEGGIPVSESTTVDDQLGELLPNSQFQSVYRERISRNSPWSISLQNLLDQPPANLPLRLLAAGILFCCIAVAWAWTGRVQEVSRAQGRLVPDGEVYKVQPVVQGEIDSVNVEEGQHVKAGQVLLKLDDRLAQTEVENLEQNLTAYRLQLAQTQGLINQTRMEAQTRRAITTAEIQAQEATIAQAKADAATSRELIAQLTSETVAHQARLTRLQPLVQAGALSTEHLFNVEEALRENQRTVTQNQGKLQQSLAQANQLQAELNQKRSEGQQSILEVQQQLQQLQIQADQLQAKITETENGLKAARTRLEQMFLYAPVDGTVSSLAIHKAGEFMQPGQTVAEIAPDGAPLVLSATLPNQEAGFVKLGMPVQIKFDAFPYQQYGIVSGTVKSISPDAIVDEKLGTVYRVEIKLDQSSISDPEHHQALQFKAGQTANAEIVTRQRRIVDVVLDPIKQLERGGLNL